MAEYTSSGQGNANTALGIIGTVGTAATVLPGLLGGTGLFGGGRVVSAEDMAVNRYEMKLQIDNAAKDAKIAQLEADKYTDEKAEEMVLKYSKSPAIAVLDLIGQDGSVDVDRVYKAVAPMVKDGEKIGIDVPMIGHFNLDKTDLEKIYKNIRG